MRLFGFAAKNEGDGARKERQEASIEAVRQGGLPLDAVDRLQEMAVRQGTDRDSFTSDLSVAELVLTRECGFEPLGQVMGSSIYHVGWQYMSGSSYWRNSGELAVQTEAYYNVRHLAMDRLRQEAKLLGADGVVGVRLEMQQYSWAAGLMEFAAIGTAVRETGVPPKSGAEPFVSSLSGQDHWALRQAGMKPVGFAMGNCTYYQAASWSTQNAMRSGIFGSGWVNQELTDFTQAFYTARELAMVRMDAEARAVGASGIVGVTIEPWYEEREVGSESNRRTDLIIHFTAIGTAIAPESVPQPMPEIPLYVPLRNTTT
jgi:uncharacterized protein YbjQ (UPF0145 family)